MKAALALVFFACIAGSMANTPGQALDQLVDQGKAVVQAVLSNLHQQILALTQRTFGQLQNLVGSVGDGRIGMDISAMLGGLQGHITDKINSLLSGLLGGLHGLISSIGGRAEPNIFDHFKDFLASIQGQVVGIGQHLLNQGLASVLGGLGSLGGSRAIGDIFAGLSAQIGSAVSMAQDAIKGIAGNIAQLGGQLLDTAKPHWEGLKESMVGHGMNVLGSLSETIGDLHSSITGGR